MKQKVPESNSFIQLVFPRYLLLSDECLGRGEAVQKCAEVKGNMPKKSR